METLLGTNFSMTEELVTQSNATKLGSTQQMLVAQFDQQAFEEMLFDKSTGPVQKRARTKKARKGVETPIIHYY